MPRRRSSGFNPLRLVAPRLFGLSQLLVLAALVLTILDLLGIPLRGVPLLPVAVLLLCVAWLMP
jgi:hypothetical protein